MKTVLLSLLLTFPAMAQDAAKKDPKPAEKTGEKTTAKATEKPAEPATKDGVTHVDAPGAKKLLDAAAEKADKKTSAPIVLDVRTADEFKTGHLKGAKNLDFLAADFAALAAKLDPAKTYVVHCQSGGRSTKCLNVLKAAGIKNLIHLDGGFGAWQKAGFAVEK